MVPSNFGIWRRQSVSFSCLYRTLMVWISLTSLITYVFFYLLWCLVVRTLTGHRSNCISVDFHPFGEFFASGSLDTNLKIWDLRKKGPIHTYKGHTRGVNVLRFTPDGRWVVSGGEDNTVKVGSCFQCLVVVSHFLI